MPLNIINLLDDLDIFLLKEIYERQTTGTKILAKDYFFKDKREDDICGKLHTKDMLVNTRLKKMSKLGLVLIEKKKLIGKFKNEYSLNLKNFKISRHKFPDKFAKVIIMKIHDRWSIFEID